MSQHSNPNRRLHGAARRQGIFWLGTIPHHAFVPYHVPGTSWIRGQLEQGEEDGYLHWQLFVALDKKGSLSTLRNLFGEGCHWELSRSEAAISYVWKEATRVAGTQFQFGSRPIQRNSKEDWESIWTAAKSGDVMAIPASIRVQSYAAIRRIEADFAQPVAMEREVIVYWGRTGSGKSRLAWDEASFSAYPKDPRTKFWCGYRGQENVVIDEFRGGIDIAHLLRWLDRYPVIVEIKGGSCVFHAKKIWITSNLHPNDWYPGLDQETLNALLRRLNITQFH